MSNTSLAITTAEEPRFRQVMKDIQESVAAYYAETAAGGDLGGHVRTWLARVQTLNDLFTEQLGDRSTYTAMFAAPATAGAELISAVKYARNVDQHLMHIVAPREDSLIGGTHGLRVYAFWELIPAATHALLRKGTQALEPAYPPFGRQVATPAAVRARLGKPASRLADDDSTDRPCRTTADTRPRGAHRP